MMDRAVKWGFLHENPFKGQGGGRCQPRRKRIFSLAEIDAMVAAAPNPWWVAFIQLGATTGLRQQELVHLQWRDFDWSAGCVAVTAKRALPFEGPDGRRYRLLEFSAKNHHERTVPVPSATIDALTRLRSLADGSPYCFLSLERLAWIEAKRQAGTLRLRYEPINNLLRDFRVIQRHAARALGDAESEIGTLHDLRRSFATRVARFVPLHVLQRWLGHSDPAVTTTYYTAVTDDYADRAREAFAGVCALRSVG